MFPNMHFQTPKRNKNDQKCNICKTLFNKNIEFKLQKDKPVTNSLTISSNT